MSKTMAKDGKESWRREDEGWAKDGKESWIREEKRGPK
jgi:hypothetical protein